MSAGIVTKGAYTEDGLAYVCDGSGGGCTKKKILLIIKDCFMGA